MVICATTSAAAPPADARVTVHLYGYTGLPPTALEEVEFVTGLLLSRAGIRVQWNVCRAAGTPDVPEECMAPVTTVRVLVRIVAHNIWGQDECGEALGAAVIQNHYATLYAAEIRSSEGRQGWILKV